MVADSGEGSVDSLVRNRIEGREHDGAILASLADPAVCFLRGRCSSARYCNRYFVSSARLAMPSFAYAIDRRFFTVPVEMPR